MSALNDTIEEIRNISYNVKPVGDENKDGIFLIMGAFEDFFIRYAEEKLNETSPKFTYESNQFGKSLFVWEIHFLWEFLLKDVRFSIRCFNLKL